MCRARLRCASYELRPWLKQGLPWYRAQVERPLKALKSIEITLGRVEWCALGDSTTSVAKEATDIQVTQVADGAHTTPKPPALRRDQRPPAAHRWPLRW